MSTNVSTNLKFSLNFKDIPLHATTIMTMAKLRVTALFLALLPTSHAFVMAPSRTFGSMRLHSTVVNKVENKVLWEPSAEYMQETAMHRFQQAMGVTGGYDELWKWSIENSDDFWSKLMDFLEVERSGSISPVKVGDTMPEVNYFPNIQLNFAENLLRHGAPVSPLKEVEAIVSISEARDDKRWSFAELRDDSARVAAALRKLGVTSKDSCAAYLPNIGETIVAMLGVTSTGSVWTSSSPDFGARAVADRFSQVGPKVLFVTDGYVSKAKPISLVDKVEELVDALPTLERIVVIPMLTEEPVTWISERVKSLLMSWDDFLAEGSEADGSAPESKFERVPFSHPQFVLYSSGTTGMPKSIAHGAGNTLLQHGKELVLHSDLRQKDRMLFFTTCGWMMWNWMTSSLFAGATVVCFDGFAAYPKLASPWDLVEKERITHMGTTPRYLQSCRARVRPGENNDLTALRVVLSTGSPLLPEDFEYVYDKVKGDVMLASISGGTDICSCFALGNPMLPVRQSELQAFGLGLDACAFDRETGRPTEAGTKGELVCRSPFVAAPVCFFGDDDKKTKYRSAYFENDDGIWYHGDLIEVTGSTGESGGIVIHGRSDTTLNPGGVRIGTAEVYRFAEAVDVVEDSLVIGELVKTGKRSDVRIVLFVKLPDGIVLDAEIEKKIRCEIRVGASDAHVPAVIKQVRLIPYTRSGKKVEIAVRDLFAGIEPKNVGALQDPNAFDEYRAMAKEGL